MNDGSCDITWADENLSLLPERALWWAREKTMFITDPHFGKGATFRLAGIAVPETSHDDDLNRLEIILQRCRAEKLVILGDFFHAKSGRADAHLSALKRWRARHQELAITLVGGNHDRHAGPPPGDWQIQLVSQPWTLGPFQCCHEPPAKRSAGFTLAGHVHPAFQLSEPGGMSARCVCFHFKKQVAILPAFGNFTGSHTIVPERGDQVFLVAGNQIIDATKAIRKTFSRATQ